jgi:sugar lactone lactonase YvrE
MRTRFVSLLVLGLLFPAALVSTVLPAFGQQLEAASPEFWQVVDKDARIEKVAGGFQLAEGPLWNPGGFLLFSDIPANQIVKYVPGSPTTVFRSPTGNSNGLTYDRAGRLVMCEGGTHRVTRLESDGKLTVLASSYEGKDLDSPNDLVIRSDGTIYFTDLPFGGVFKISPEGELTLLAKDFERPNGLAFSPDEKILYVDDMSRLHVRAFEVAEDGSVSNGRVLAEMKPGPEGAPDGMKVDSQGNLYVTGPGGLWVFDPTGKHLGTLRVPERLTNCGWGDKDYRTLYLTARTALYKIRLKIPGFITYPTAARH